jgi:hypothetical protein
MKFSEWSKFSNKELKNILKQNKIKNYSNMNKAELLEKMEEMYKQKGGMERPKNPSSASIINTSNSKKHNNLGAIANNSRITRASASAMPPTRQRPTVSIRDISTPNPINSSVQIGVAHNLLHPQSHSNSINNNSQLPLASLAVSQLSNKLNNKKAKSANPVMPAFSLSSNILAPPPPPPPAAAPPPPPPPAAAAAAAAAAVKTSNKKKSSTTLTPSVLNNIQKNGQSKLKHVPPPTSSFKKLTGEATLASLLSSGPVSSTPKKQTGEAALTSLLSSGPVSNTPKKPVWKSPTSLINPVSSKPNNTLPSQQVTDDIYMTAVLLGQAAKKKAAANAQREKNEQDPWNEPYASSQGSLASGQGASASSQGASTSSKGSLASGQGASASSQGASASINNELKNKLKLKGKAPGIEEVHLGASPHSSYVQAAPLPNTSLLPNQNSLPNTSLLSTKEKIAAAEKKIANEREKKKKNK